MTHPPWHVIAEPQLTRTELAPGPGAGAIANGGTSPFQGFHADLEHAQTSSRSIQPSRRSMAGSANRCSARDRAGPSSAGTDEGTRSVLPRSTSSAASRAPNLHSG